MIGLRVPLASLALLLLLLAGSALSLSVSASASGVWLRHRLGMKPLTVADPCIRDADHCFDGCASSQGAFTGQNQFTAFFNINGDCRYEWGPDVVVNGVTKKATCVNLEQAIKIFANGPTGFCPNLKQLAVQLLAAEFNIDPAIGNAYASCEILTAMAQARLLVWSDNCGIISAPLPATIEGLKNQLEAFNLGKAAGSAGHCNKVAVSCPGDLEAESGYGFGPVSGSTTSVGVVWSAANLPPNFVIDSATGKITSSLVEVVSVTTTYHFTLFAKLESGAEWHGGADCCSITVYPKYEVGCLVVAGTPPTIPVFTIDEDVESFTVTATGGADPINPALTLTITGGPGAPAMPAGITFTSPVGTNPRVGTLSGVATGQKPAPGLYTYSLTSTDKLGHVATATGCSFEIFLHYEVTCPVGLGGPDSLPTFTVNAPLSSTFTVTAIGGVDPVSPLTLAVTAEDPAFAPLDLPVGVTFSSPVGTDPRVGELSGTATNNNEAGVYTYTLTSTEAGRKHVITCKFEVLRSQNQDVFEGCTYTIGFYKNHPKQIFPILGLVQEIRLGQLTLKNTEDDRATMVKILSFTYSLKLNELSTTAIACPSKDPVGKAMAQALAARISIAHGALPTAEVLQALATVDEAMINYGCGSKDLAKDLDLLNRLKAAQPLLDTFNNGCLAGNPLHCVDDKYTAPKPPYVRPTTCLVV